MAPTPHYYPTEDTVTVTALEKSLKGVKDASVSATASFIAAELIDKIDKLLKKPGSSETFRFLVKSVTGNTLSTTTTTKSFTISDETLKDIAGGTATDIGLWIISNLSPQSRILALSAGALSAVSSLIWTGIKTGIEFVSESDVVNLIYGTVPVDIQIVDQNNNVIGGALFKEGLSEEQELEAIQNLLGRTLSTRFPDISIGSDRIRVVEDTVFFPREKEYKVYDGRFVDAISLELGIAKEELLGLGQENSPNINSQIYYSYEAPFLKKSFVFASDENRFFVPLPNTTGGVTPVGLHPDNIISGSSGNDTLDALDAFQDRDPDLLFNKQNVLLLGLEGDDIINGNIENDIIVGGKGNDTIDGGLGEDIAIFSDVFANYEPYLTKDGSTIFYHSRGTQADGVDTLRGVEFAKFQDQIVPLPLNIPTTNPAPKPNLLSKGINIKQIGSDNIITGEAIISGSYIYWEDKTNRVLSLNTNTLEIKEITNSGLDSEFLYDFWYEFARGNESGLVENNKIAVRLKTSNGSLPSQSDDVALYDGNSLISIGAVSNISVFDTQAIWQQNDLVSAYDYDSKRVNILADNRFGNISGLPTFPSSNSSEFSISNKSVAWLGDLSGFATEVYFYDGEKTIQLTNYTRDYLANPLAEENYRLDQDNIYTSENSVVWTARRINARGFTDESRVFLYDGSKVVQIGSFSNKLLSGIYDEGLVTPPQISGKNVVWSTITQATDTGNFNDYTHTLYLYDGSQTKAIHQVTRTHTDNSFDLERGIRNLQIEGNNIAWLDRLESKPTDTEFFRKRLLYSYNIADKNPQARIIYEGENKISYLEISDNLTAWIVGESSDELYVYDGKHIHQLSDKMSGPRSPYPYFSQLEVLSDRVIWVGEAQGTTADGNIFGDDEVFVATFSNMVAPTPTPDPIPTPTPDPIPTPTPDPIPTPTPDPIPTPTPDPIPTPTPDPIPTPTPDPIPTPTPDPIPTPTPDPIPTPTSKLRVSLVESKSNLVNELAVFTVDDAAGTINGLALGSEGYVQAALNKARSIFSTITNLPNGFDNSNLSSIIEFNTSSSQRFMLVKNSTLDNAKNGITPISNLLFSTLSLQQIPNLADSVFPVSWKDSFGNTTDFEDFMIKIGANTDALPLGTAIQSKSGIELIDLRSDLPPNEIVKADFSIYREAAFNNYVGFYKIDNTDGNITDPFTGKTLKPGDVGYIQTAVSNRVAGIDLKVSNNSIATLSGEFISGSLFAPFIIINASPTEVLDTNTQNDPNVYFAFLGANTDGVDHIRLLGNNVFGFEDLPNGGDLDYNDMVIAANFRMI